MTDRTTSSPLDTPVGPSRAQSPLLARSAGFFGLWIVLMPSLDPADLAIGVVSAAVATWVSLRLLPPASGHVRFGVLLAFAPHFFWESVRAGTDVARRVFSPDMKLKPGYVTCPLALPRGLARNTFATIASLWPGSVPAGDDDGVLAVHCLDTTQPVVEQLCAEERALAKALVAGHRHE
jgi:multicomponent Na+:H+ antiporter subunit E